VAWKDPQALDSVRLKGSTRRETGIRQTGWASERSVHARRRDRALDVGIEGRHCRCGPLSWGTRDRISRSDAVLPGHRAVHRWDQGQTLRTFPRPKAWAAAQALVTALAVSEDKSAPSRALSSNFALGDGWMPLS